MRSTALTPFRSPARSARLAVALVFFMHGALTGGWVPHIPLAKEGLGVGTGAFGWLLLAMAGGGVAAMPVAGVLIGRLGAPRSCVPPGFCSARAFLCPSMPRIH